MDEKNEALDKLEKAYERQAVIRKKEMKEEEDKYANKKYNDLGIEESSMV